MSHPNNNHRKQNTPHTCPHNCEECAARRLRRRPEPVILNIYDMMKINDFTTPLGLGVFHTGVEVFGVEFGYAGHNTAESGIFEITPRDDRELGEHFQYRESLFMGRIRYTLEEVRDIIAHLGTHFRGDSYHLTKNNCNHFSNTLIKALVGREIPHWVNRLAYIFAHLPLLQRCLPKEMLQPGVERPLPEEMSEQLSEHLGRERHENRDFDDHRT